MISKVAIIIVVLVYVITKLILIYSFHYTMFKTTQFKLMCIKRSLITVGFTIFIFILLILLYSFYYMFKTTQLKLIRIKMSLIDYYKKVH